MNKARTAPAPAACRSCSASHARLSDGSDYTPSARTPARPPPQIKTTTGSFVPWADNAVQRVFQLGTAPVDWAAAEKALSRVQPRDAKGIVALAKAELELKGVAAMQARARACVRAHAAHAACRI